MEKSLATSEQHNQRQESAPVVHVHFSRRMLILLAILLICPCLIIAGAMVYPQVLQPAKSSPAHYSEETNAVQISEGNPGPWGQLVYTNLMIDVPDEFISLPPPEEPVRWFFKDYTKDGVMELFKSAGVSEAQLRELLSDDAWQSGADGVWLTPGDKLILELSPSARSKIYAVLFAFSENANRIDVVWFRPETMDKQLKECGLAHSSIKLLKGLIYHDGSELLFFADKDTALRQIPDNKEKQRFLKAIYRKTTLMASLKIDAHTDVEALANYWGVGGRHKDILPLMKSLQRVEGGWNLSVVFLLPPFMRSHLYNFPFPSADPQAPKQDCFWSAFNTFNSQPDDRLGNLQYVPEVLANEYYSIAQPSQLGDIVFLADSANDAMHVAVYVADDIVFTKNGYHSTQPWILMHLKDMVETYDMRAGPGKSLKLFYYRRKSL